MTCTIMASNTIHVLVGLALLLIPAGLTQVLVFEVEEEAAPGLLGNVAEMANLTKVLGAKELKSLQYAMVEDKTDTQDRFYIDRTSGDISIQVTLDRERLCGSSPDDCFIEGNIVVQSTSPDSAFFRKFAMMVKVVDVNDNPPVFSESSFVVNIPENTVADTDIVLPTATDQDAKPQFKVQRYVLQPNFDQFQLSVVKTSEPLGETQFVVSLKVLRPLDREKQQLFITNLVAFDGGSPPNKATLPLSIDVIDRNDNTPKFDFPEYSQTLSEGVSKDSTALVVRATDGDEGDNARVSYFMADSASIVVKSLFHVNQDTGVIKVMASLNNRGGNTFQFEVIARDNGVPQKKSACRVVIRVKDTLNDKPVVEVNPLFSRHGLAVVPESAAIGRVASLVTVRDYDSGRNGVVSCRLDNPFFSLQNLEHNEYKVVVASPLDREQMSNHTVTIHCTDGGDPPLSTDNVLHVEVSDNNDNAPQFESLNYVLTVMENEVVGTWVGQVKAHDADSGDNARLIYGMDHNGDTFTIDTMLGDIYTTRFLDREAKSQYVITVFAYDKSASSLTATTTVIVKVDDQNDMRPVFTQPSYTFISDERTTRGSVVGQVKATDGDLGLNARVQYYMVMSHLQPRFPISVNLSGAVLVTGQLDFEASNVYVFTVAAVDQGIPPQNSTCQVTVEVVDNNDHSPVITFPSQDNPSVSIPLDTAPGAKIANIAAYDLDSGPNGDLRYSISVANASSLFFIDEMSGVITLGNRILPGDVRSYNIVVSVRDNGIPQMAQQAILKVDITSTGSSLGSGSNLIMVIALVSVTLILALAVLTTLLLIRCFDRRRLASEKHRHEVLTKFGYHAEPLEKKGSDRTGTIFTSSRHDTGLYSPKKDFELQREGSSLHSPNRHFDPVRENLYGSKHGLDSEAGDMSTNSPTKQSQVNRGGSFKKDPNLKREQDFLYKNENIPCSPKLGRGALKANSPMRYPEKEGQEWYTMGGDRSQQHQDVEPKPKRKVVSFERDRHPSIREEEGDLSGHGGKSSDQHTYPVQVVGELHSPGSFSTFKPSHTPSPADDRRWSPQPGADDTSVKEPADTVHSVYKPHNSLPKTIKNARFLPYQQNQDPRGDMDAEEWSSSSVDTSDSGHGGSEFDVSTVKISV